MGSFKVFYSQCTRSVFLAEWKKLHGGRDTWRPLEKGCLAAQWFSDVAACFYQPGVPEGRRLLLAWLSGTPEAPETVLEETRLHVPLLRWSCEQGLLSEKALLRVHSGDRSLSSKATETLQNNKMMFSLVTCRLPLELVLTEVLDKLDEKTFCHAIIKGRDSILWKSKYPRAARILPVHQVGESSP